MLRVEHFRITTHHTSDHASFEEHHLLVSRFGDGLYDWLHANIKYDRHPGPYPINRQSQCRSIRGRVR